jgi:RNA polymerase sigma factor (TIGR02999 family)
VRLANNEKLRVTDRDHFFAIAAKSMRHVLADHARAKGRQKRGGGQDRVTLSGLASDFGEADFDAADIDAALHELAELNDRHATIVELRFFAGFTIEQVATYLNVSKRTVDDDWSFARAWLRKRLALDAA